MTLIEKHLHEHFASLNETDILPASGSTSGVPLPDSLPDVLEEPFAKVNAVSPSSPAERAGLKAGDLIRSFGYVNRANHDGLKKVAECVQGNEGVSCYVANSGHFHTAQTSSQILSKTSLSR